MEDYYTIQTPEHHSSLFTQLHSLQKQGVMCDVILAAEDGEVMAHKVILMAVSKYFREKLSPVISSTATRVFLKGTVLAFVETVLFLSMAHQEMARRQVREIEEDLLYN